MEELDVGEFVRLYCDSINTKFDSKVLPLTGFYRRIGSKAYNGIYYDALFSKESGLSLTLLVSEEQREQLTDGKNYTVRGYINRFKKFDKGANINLQFKALKIDGENKEVQLVKEEEYDLLKTRFERGFIDIKSLILERFEEGFKTRIAIITGQESIVDKDFDSQFSDHGKYHIEFFRTNLSNATSLAEYLETEDFTEYDILAFMRGGGTGLDIFNDDRLCQTILDIKLPFITALGHQDDLVMLSKIADKNLATPSALGTFLQNIGREYDEKMSLIEGLQQEINKRDQELLKKEQELESTTLSIRSQLDIRKAQLRTMRIWIFILILIIIGLGYILYDKIISNLI